MNSYIQNKEVWNIEVISQAVSTSSFNELRELESLNITTKIKFRDDLWDFSYIFRPDSSYTQKYEFSKVKSYTFKLLLKRMVLQDRFITKKRMTTTWKKFYQARRFLIFLEDRNITNPEKIEVVDLENYTQMLNYTNYSSKSSVRSDLKNFFSICEHFKLSENVNNLNAFLDNYCSWQSDKKYVKFGTTMSIPDAIQSKMIKCAIADLNNNDLTTYSRLAAGIIIVLFYTGMRRGEVRLLEANKLEEISIFNNKESAYFLTFKTFKTTKQLNGRWTKSNGFPELVKAYKMLEKLTFDRRKKFNLNYLFLSMNGKVIGSSQLYTILDNFFYRNQIEIGFSELNDNDRLMLKTRHFSITHYRCYGTDKDKTVVNEHFFTIAPHQFRVALANNLKNQVSLEWIQEHMNHLSNEMTRYYFRDDEEVKATLRYKASKDGTQIENNSIEIMDDQEMKDATDTINTFLTEKNLNIFKDLDEILNYFKNNPLNESLVGLCSKAIIMICDRQDKLNTIEKWYFNAPAIASLESLDFTIERFFEKCKVVYHNKTLAEKNKIYTRNFEVEYESLSRFYSNRLIPEIELLNSELQLRGFEKTVNEHNNLIEIINNYDSIKKEIKFWKEKLTLKN